MIVYIGNLKHSTIRELISEQQDLSLKHQYTKILYATTIRKGKLLDDNIYNVILKTKCLEINLTKCEAGLLTENNVMFL